MTSKILLILTLVLGILIGYVLRVLIVKRIIKSKEKELEEELQKAKREAKEIIVDAKNKAVLILEEAKKEEKKRFEEISKREERIFKKEEELENKLKEVENEKNKLKDELNKVLNYKKELENLKEQKTKELEKIANMKVSEAREMLIKEVESMYQNDLIEIIKRFELYRKEEIEKRSINIITTVLPRYSRSVVSEFTTTPFYLESDDIKGKIIGKEGRNIRYFENLTGVEIIIDETPGVVTLSCFDPVRREIAKLALEKLIKDGRIHPAKIEEKVKEASEEINNKIKEAGENAAYQLGILNLPPQILHLMGRLAFRTSYGQNVLTHSIETGIFARMIAEELGLDSQVALLGGFLHDIGKSVDHEIEGNHVDLGIKILQKYGIDKKVIDAMKSHHETYPYEIPEAYVVTAADVLSATRPGARSDTFENYLKRLEDLEKIAYSFEGVQKAYAISGGREIRVFVIPEKIDDVKMAFLAKDISKKIEEELKYPGEIKVVVIRETRAVEYAR
jgi:ribonuclease Y